MKVKQQVRQQHDGAEQMEAGSEENTDARYEGDGERMTRH